jgi:hypothetical protein
MTLTDHQIETIEKEIENSAIQSRELKDDLLDHFCCAIEIRTNKGLDFEDAFILAKNDICPNGLDEIQTETIYLLNAKKLKIMKKIMFTTGLVFSMALSLGFLFKLMHWPGANVLLMSGTWGMGFVFIPMIAIHQLRLSTNKVLSEKLRHSMGLLSGVLFSLSVLFKFFHLMGADILFVLSLTIFTFGFLPFLFFKMYRKSI